MCTSPRDVGYQQHRLRTGAWYGDGSLDLNFPASWDVRILWPRTPPPITEDQIAQSLEQPIGQPHLRELCRNVKRPLIIIDDVNRPTPVDLVFPHILRVFQSVGISPEQVTILLATGTHGAPGTTSVRNKVGPIAAAACRIVLHDANGPLAYIGKTTLGTPVLANKEILASDFTIGIGGIYPNQSAGYGGGAKLALGVLGYESILHLHYAHSNAGWGAVPGRNTFREDLNQIAGMLGIKSMISLQVNGHREPIRITCGDYLAYYQQEVTFARAIFTVPPPQDADVVISNAYPSDLSLTFALMKGSSPLYRCQPYSSRVLLASCPEGLGSHGLFPVFNTGRLRLVKQYSRLAKTMTLPAFLGKVARVAKKKLIRRREPTALANRTFNHPIWVNQSAHGQPILPEQIARVRVTNSWPELLDTIDREQGVGRSLKVVIYPCASLLSIDSSSDRKEEIKRDEQERLW